MQSGNEQILDEEKLQSLLSDERVQLAVDKGMLDIAEVKQTRIKITCTIGQVVLYEKILDTDVYPIVPVPNIWTNTPYPMSDVRKNKDSQIYLYRAIREGLGKSKCYY